MNLQTQIPLQTQSNNQIDYHSSVLLLGSCFVENIGNKMDFYKFQNFQNPFGILFHPIAIETLIANAINKKEYIESDIFIYNEQWHCFESHSKLSNPSSEALLLDLNKLSNLTNQQLNNTSHLIVTLGTAWVYRLNESNAIVANCHKLPQKQFSKKLLSVIEIKNSLQAIIDIVKKKNPKVKFIFTISPVRHLKDGFIENTQGKAHLTTAVHQIIDPSQNVHYFPSYEIMMDELRDYRFYAEDMVHPNQTAVNYIWEKFKQVWITKDAQKTMDEVESVQRGLGHKPFNENSSVHQEFLQNLEEKKRKLQSLYSHIVF